MKSKRLLILLLMALLVPWAANAQSPQIVTIGEGTSTGYYPLPGFYGWNYDVYLYTPTSATALGTDCTIDSIAYNISSNSTSTGAEMTIWVKDVPSDYVLSKDTTFAQFIAGATRVYTNDDFSSTSGWNYYKFASSFEHDGDKALLIAVRGVGCADNGGCSRQCYYTSVTGTHWGKHNDYSDPGTALTGTVNSERPNIRLGLFYTETPCFSPTLLEATLTSGNGTIATLSWIENGNSDGWTLRYGSDANFAAGTYTELETGFNVGDTITANLTGLTAEQTYYAQVKPNCDTEGTKWSNTISFTPTDAYSLVVNDGTTTHYYIPFYYYYVSYSSYQIRSQFITPATTEELADVKWGTINKLVFYNSSASVDYGDAQFAVYVAEVPETTMTEFFDWSTLTNVYTGTVSVSDNEMEITFSTPFHYMGGNLLVGFNRTATGTSPSSNTWVGKSGTSGCSRYYGSSESSSNFLPKMKIYYIPGEEPDCLPVSALEVTEASVSSTEIPITWTGHNETSWNIRWRKYGTTDTYSTATSTTPSYTITGLTGNTKYEFGVQAGCDEDDIWTSGSYTTECGVETSIHEKFDSYTGTTSGSTNNLPHCWDYYNGTTSSYNAGYPLIYSGSSYSGSNHLRFYSYYSSSYTYTDQYAILPAVENASAMRVSLMAQLYSYYSYSSYSYVTYPGELVVGVMSNPADLTTFIAVDTIKPTSSYEQFIVNLDRYDGTGNRIALKMTPATSSQTYRYVMVDNLVVEVIPDCETPTGLALKSDSQTPEGATIVWNPGNASSWFVEYKKNSESEYTAIATPVADTFYTFMGLDANTPYNARIKVNCTTGTGITYPTDPVSFTTAKACPAPKNLVVSNVTGTSATLAWTPGYNETEWTVKYKVSDSATYITAPTVSGTPTINLAGLYSGTTYDVQIIGCDEANVYTVTKAFTTAFTAPYLQAFAASSIPAGWNNYSTLLAPEVLNGTTPLSGSGSWIFSNTNVFGAYHAKLNIYGNNCKSWLLTPNIVVGSGQVLSFDLALTDYGYETPIEDTTAQSDDKFIVLVSTNNGTTWSILRQWNNAGSEYVYNRIATTGETVYIDLAGFSGQTVRIAFYGESTIDGNGDNDLHIDNVSIDLPPTCYRPLGLTASDVTNHSAKLSWTAGTEDQTAWQIAYRKGTTFNPADTTLDWTTVTIVDVTTNPYTFVKTLDAASTYYMYVRANCGDEEYSEWCRKVCSFTTKAAAPAPTNFQKTDVGPDFATLTWKAGGGDYEANYDLYVVQSATTPATPTIDTVPTIAGITELPTAENPYLLDGLDNEKRYYVWVRANHVHPDTTMHSAWVAISDSYFTTLVACPTPTTKPVTNLQPYSATLNWTGYSESYNVRYREVPQAVGDTVFSESFDGGSIPSGWTNQSGWTVESSYVKHTSSSSGGSYYLIMPAMDFSTYSSLALSFNYKTPYYSSSYPDDIDGFGVYYRVNGGEWNELFYEVALHNDWTEKTLPLTGLAANYEIGFRMVNNWGGGVFIDEIVVLSLPVTPWISANNGEPIEVTSVDIAELADSTRYEWQVQATCANDWSASAYFTTIWACTAPVADSVNSITYNSADLYWTGYQDEYNVRYRVYEIDSVTLYDNFDDGNANGWSRNDGGVYHWTGDYSDYFILLGNGVTTTQYLISPELSEYPEGSMVQFWHAGLDETEAVTFQVGYSSTTTELDAFTWGFEVTALIQDYDLFEEEIPAGTKYIAVKSTSPTEDACLLIDEFAVYNVLVPMGEWQYANNVTSPATITGLEDERWYEWQVQGNNTVCTGDTTAWSESDYFITDEMPPMQRIELSAGWNWVSTYIDLNEVDGIPMLEAALGDYATEIQTFGESAEYFGDGEWAGLEDYEWTNAEMVMVYVLEDCTITLVGPTVDPSTVEIEINTGWNWIGFPLAAETDIEVALADFEPVEGDIIATSTLESDYIGEWLDLETLAPGQGYMYYSSSEDTKTLVFKAGVERARSSVKPIKFMKPMMVEKVNSRAKCKSNKLDDTINLFKK